MANRIDTLEQWTQAYQIVDTNIALNLEFLMTAPYSDLPDSPYQLAQVHIEELYDNLKMLSVTGLKLVDETVSQSELMLAIEALTNEAQIEADLIRNTTATIDRLAESLGKVGDIVGKFADLPFVSLV